MPSDKPNVATPGQTKANSGTYEKIFPEGSTIEIKDETGNPVFCIIRQGAVSVEMDIKTPKGIHTLQMGLLEPGETFNEDCLFGGKTSETPVRFRAKTRCVIMRLTRDMLPKEADKLTRVFEAMARSKANQDRKQREYMAYSIQLYEERLAQSANEQASLTEELDERKQELEATTVQMASTQRHLETARQKVVESYRELQDSKAFTKTLESKSAIRALELRKAKEHEAEVVKMLTTEIVRAQEATQSAEKALHNIVEHGRKIALALERLERNNPALILDETTLALLLGEEPIDMVKPQRVQDDSDIDEAIDDFLSEETPTGPSQTLIPPSGVPGPTFRFAPSPFQTTKAMDLSNFRKQAAKEDKDSASASPSAKATNEDVWMESDSMVHDQLMDFCKKPKK